MIGDLDPAHSQSGSKNPSQNQAGSKLGVNSKSGEKPLKKYSVPKHVASKPSSSEHPNKAGAIRSPSSNQIKHPKSSANKPKVPKMYLKDRMSKVDTVIK